jgi:hypothetical protein
MKNINNNDRAELVVDSVKRTTPFMLKGTSLPFDLHSAKGAWVIAPFVFINTGRSIYKRNL